MARSTRPTVTTDPNLVPDRVSAEKMDSRAKQLAQHGDKMFDDRLGVLGLWQELSDNFCVQIADFTLSRSIGSDMTSHLTTSQPLLVQRELKSQIGMMLRPKEIQWANMATTNPGAQDTASRRWLEWASALQYRAMYARPALLQKACTSADDFYSTLGQCVISCEMNRDYDDLFYQCHHLRDVAFAENAKGVVDRFERKWNPTAIVLNQFFRGNTHANVKALLTKSPFQKIECRNTVLSKEDWEYIFNTKCPFNQPYVSIWYDCTNGFILEQVGSWTTKYIAPRWQTVGGSQYAFSPSGIIGLADARLIQEMMLTILEAGQKSVNPAMIATQQAIRSDVNLVSGGITWVDAEYDERLGTALRPVDNDFRGLPIGMQLQEKVMSLIGEAFYLDKLRGVPTDTKVRTAYETAQIVQDYIRQAIPLFEPMEGEYNGQLCEITFDTLKHAGAFGNPADMPPALRGQGVEFKFRSPLSQAEGAEKNNQFLATKAILTDAATLDPSALQMVNTQQAIKDVLAATVPAAWIRTDEEMAAIKQQTAAQTEQTQTVQNLSQGADALQKIGDAGQSINAALNPNGQAPAPRI